MKSLKIFKDFLVQGQGLVSWSLRTRTFLEDYNTGIKLCLPNLTLSICFQSSVANDLHSNSHSTIVTVSFMYHFCWYHVMTNCHLYNITINELLILKLVIYFSDNI